MTPPAVQRAIILQQQNRHADAIKELHQHLSTSPRDAFAHAMLADSLLELDKYDDAEREAKEAVGIAPDEAFGHTAMARVLHKRNRFKTAENAIRCAIGIDSHDPYSYGTLGAILLDQRRFKDALDAADQGLSIDPRNALCLNVRAIALTQLGNRDAASATMEGALAENPENAFTHANHGWTLLHRNKPQEAMEHFREALRLDPTLEFARAGIVEALKARNPLYRWLLKYFLFMSRLDQRVSWAIMVGGFLGYRALRQAADRSPALAPYINPILIAYIVFALSTWLASTLFNLVLRFHPFGKHALSRNQRMTSNLTGGILLLAAGFGITYAVTGWLWPMLAGLASLGIALPASMLFTCSPGWPRWAMVGILAVLVIGAIAAITAFISPGSEDLGIRLFQMFAWGCVIAQFASQFLAQQRPTK